MSIAALVTWLIAAGLGFTMVATWSAQGVPRMAPAGRAAPQRRLAGVAGRTGPGSGQAPPVAGTAQRAPDPVTTGPGRYGDAAITRLAPGVVFGHLSLAGSGLVVWMMYMITGFGLLAWIAFAVLLLVAVLGEMMFLRWLRPRATATVESVFARPVVYGHGLFAVATVVLVLLVALRAGRG